MGHEGKIPQFVSLKPDVSKWSATRSGGLTDHWISETKKLNFETPVLIASKFDFIFTSLHDNAERNQETDREYILREK